MKDQGSKSRTNREKQILKMLGEKIREHRLNLGLTQEEFARLASFSRSYYTEIENGKRNISYLNLINILMTLDTDANSLIQLSNSNQKKAKTKND